MKKSKTTNDVFWVCVSQMKTYGNLLL